MRSLLIILFFCATHFSFEMKAQTGGKPISENLFGIFFEDLNYAADGGLYAEMVQNRSFEYSPSDIDLRLNKQNDWHYFTAWQYLKEGNAIATLSLENSHPIHPNNPHYLTIDIRTVGKHGAGIRNNGYDGMTLKSGESYLFSVFLRRISDLDIPVKIQLSDAGNKIIAETEIIANSNEWKQYKATLAPTADSDSASLSLLFQEKGAVNIDMVSLFPQKTFKNRPNGLRCDIAETIAAIKPAFVRFPGGCLAHGDGIFNIYNWKNTIGPVEQRKEDRNIWNYHQTFGLGYFEYLLFCEDIGAKAIPVVAAGVSCQNSARTNGTGQECIPMEDMPAYIRDVLDLIEYCNGSATSFWGKKRAEAGHPEPFGLEYIGIGNEDKITPEFEVRFKMICKAIQEKYPEIKVIGTSGPFPEGDDFENGWKIARNLDVAAVDEHYYQMPEWFLNNMDRYNKYPRSGPKVYLGEYASKGNTLYNALAEAAYMTGLERNGDVVELASYAPLLARIGHTQWNPDLIYFDWKGVYPTVNYFVQKLFSTNKGNAYFADVVNMESGKNLASSCVQDTETGDIILKLVNISAESAKIDINLKSFKKINPVATLITLKGNKEAKNTREEPTNVVPQEQTLKVSENFNYELPPYSLSIIRIKTSVPSEKDMSAYLLAYHLDETHGLHFALSRDGYTFTALNDNKPIVAGDTIANQRGIRDPHIYRGPDGAFYLTMTDLHAKGKEAGFRDTETERDRKTYGPMNNRGIVLMKSLDLINWTHTAIRIDTLSEELSEIGCAWAPEVIYDEERDKLMVHFAIRFRNEALRMYYVYANDDFNRIETLPQLLWEYPVENIGVLDANITKFNGKYYLFYAVNDGTAGGVKLAVSDKINGDYVFDPRFYDFETASCEALSIWKRIGEDKWVLMVDVSWLKPQNFGFAETSDFANFTYLGHFNDGVMKATNFIPKHGSIIHLAAEEADRLEGYWKSKMENFSTY
ncbi:MAG: hypothetical protein LBR84_01345 [Tannerella sp.]|nr:hypothetical protein [Tannerella sp.]